MLLQKLRVDRYQDRAKIAKQTFTTDGRVYVVLVLHCQLFFSVVVVVKLLKISFTFYL